MNPRDDVLGRVRAALTGADRTSPEVPLGHRDVVQQPVRDALLDLFTERVEDYRAAVTRCASDEVTGTLARILDGRSAVVPDGLPWPVANGVPDTGQSARELDRIDAVVTTAAVGIAETGTLVLDHGPAQGRRALTLVPDVHVCVIRAGQVVRSVPEAIARLDPSRPTTWISGPSATSDIELSRVEGVHGPRTLHVVLLSPA